MISNMNLFSQLSNQSSSSGGFDYKFTDKLAKIRDKSVDSADYACELASSTADPEVLDVLSQVPSLVAREIVASNSNIHLATLARLSESKYFTVRVAAAKNPNLSKSLRKLLLRDPSLAVRIALAMREDLGADEINVLKEDSSELVRISLILTHPLAVPSAVSDSSPLVRSLHAITPSHYCNNDRRKLCDDSDFEVASLSREHHVLCADIYCDCHNLADLVSTEERRYWEECHV